MVNAHLEPFLLRGAPDPLAGHADGTHATVSRRGLITIIGSQSAAPWSLTADAQWPSTARLSPTPWVVAALTPDEDLLVLNLARVDIRGLPAGHVRGLRLQAEQFCSTAPQQWAKTATVKAAYTHDSHLLVGSYSLAAPTPLQIDEDVFSSELAKTFSGLSPKRRQIALLLQRHDGMTLEQLATHFAGPQATPKQLRDTRSALHVEFTRLRQHPEISLKINSDGVYTISRISVDDYRGQAVSR